MLTVSSIAHVAICVKDIASILDFYGKAPGFVGLLRQAQAVARIMGR